MAEAQKKRILITSTKYGILRIMLGMLFPVRITTKWYFHLHFFADWNALLNQHELLYVMQ